MKHPPYHLRANKAVDRFMLVEVVRRVSKLRDLSDARFLSLSGPYLEDLRMMRRHFPHMSLTSIEMDAGTLRRQEFHRFSSDLKLRPGNAEEILDECEDDQPVVLWLDFIDNDLKLFRTFQVAVKKCAPWSVTKITLNADPERWAPEPEKRLKHAMDTYADCLGAWRPTLSDVEPAGFPQFLQHVTRKAAEQALLAFSSASKVFIPVCSVIYKDSAQMFTLTGVLCPAPKKRALQRAFREWHSANLDWNQPTKLQMPHLSVKERLRLDEVLPANKDPHKLLKHLGYLIGDNEEDTLELLKNYADYHDYYPLYARFEA